ncbi:response regulator [Leptobacterium flavescens]|uniref:Response regulator n=1 Tax=Leptobacterium flavescens TaxID=472055 RepID=A0A6P0US51_9FLAO|nr:response regulator transcription factor [Leptobacterium flavescens]NER13206.1 response regulator [Leptobacterium flavescens]
MITLAIAEDHQALIDGIYLLLEYEEEIEIVGFANDGEALIEIVNHKQPKVVLTDIRMPKIDGIAACRLIKKKFPHIKVLAFTMFDQEEAVKQMMEAGADGYLLKNSELKNVLTAIKSVIGGKPYFDANLTIDPDGEAGPKRKKSLLSKREREILLLIGQGKTSSDISSMLFIGQTTVETHRKNMIRKLGLKGKGELLRYALEKKYDF